MNNYKQWLLVMFTYQGVLDWILFPHASPPVILP